MLRSPVPEMVHCPHCWASNAAIEPRCGACGKPLAIYIGPVMPASARFGLGSMMLMIACAGVSLAAARLNPGLGIVAAGLSSLSLWRAHRVIGQEKALGFAPTMAQKAGVLLGSAAVVMAIFLLTALVFFGAAILVGSLCVAVVGPPGIALGGLAGVLPAAHVAAQLRRELWMPTG